jgi:hypothetical protein
MVPCCPLANAACRMPRREDPFEGQARLPAHERSMGSEIRKMGPLTCDTAGEIIIFIERIAVLLAMIRIFLRYSSILLHTNIIRY